MHVLQRWEIEGMINNAVSNLAKDFEVRAVRGDVDRLEHSLREARAEADGLRNELQELRQSFGTIQDALIQLQQMAHGALSEREKQL